jgi:minor extracellular serine protease Vpr
MHSMKQRSQALCRRAVAVLLGTALGIGTLSTAFSSERLHRPATSPSTQVEVFVRLDTPSVAELNITSMDSTGAMASSAAQKAQAARVETQQATFRQQLAGYQARELSHLRVGANGLRVVVPASAIDSIRKLPGVVSVGPVEKHRPDNIESVPSIGAPNVWANLGVKGEGVRIGVIDSGIDYLHANLGGAGNAGDYAANDKNVVEAGTFPTAKVVGGHDFAGAKYDADDPASVPTPDDDPLDGNGHGSHVAGTIAGIGVPGRIGPGVAPEAKLYALKVFSDTEGSTNLTSDAIEWALDPNQDGDMSDHLDVINMSLGSPFGEPEDPSAISSQNAAELGIIVVTSAGNEGDTPYITGAPAVARAAISTAAITPKGQSNGQATVNAPANLAGPKNSAEGAGAARFRDNPPITDVLVKGNPLNGCGPLTNAAAVSGHVVLIVRGACNFIVKYQAAQAAGARALVVYNDGANAGRIDPIVMGGLDSSITVPGLMISFPDGSALAGVATTDASSPAQVTLQSVKNPATDDLIASFSSRGPGSGAQGFKPDLSAPGTGIVSTGVGTGNLGAALDGTSMASPHVAGSAALLHQLHPNLRPAAIKALLQNSTVDVNAAGDTSLARQGVGAIRVDAAAALTSYAAPGGVSFGRLNPQFPIHVDRDIHVHNMSRFPRLFIGKDVPHQTFAGVNVFCPKFVWVGGHDSRKVDIDLFFNPFASAAAGLFDESSISQTEVDGWCELSDGKDTLRIGYLAVVDPASGIQASGKQSVVDIRNSGPAGGMAEGFTLVGSGGKGAKHTYSSISKLGVRRGDPNLYLGFPVLEFAVTVDESWEHISNLTVDLLLDVDKDGVPDVELVAADWTTFEPPPPDGAAIIGTYLTAQFNAKGGFLDWGVSTWDFNDRVVILPFTTVAGGGLVPDSFNYTLTLTDRQGAQDVQTGTIDMANEIVPDLNSFQLDRGEKVSTSVTSGKGKMLWIFPGNPARDQEDTVQVDSKPKKKH